MAIHVFGSCVTSSIVARTYAAPALPPTRQKKPSPPQDLGFLLNLDPRSSDDRKRYDDSAVLAAIRRDPNAAKAAYLFEAYGHRTLSPLAMAVALGASREVVQELCDANPEAFLYPSSGGFTPLHFACRFEAPTNVVELLLEKCPSAVKNKSNSLWTPLHWACCYGSSLGLVALLAKYYPEAVGMRDVFGITPIMLARQSNASQEVTTLLETLRDLLYLDPKPSDDEVMAMLRNSCQVWSVAAATLHLRTGVVPRMGIDSVTMPTLMARVGQEGRVQTMFEIVRESMVIFEGAGTLGHAQQINDDARTGTNRSVPGRVAVVTLTTYR